MCEFYVFLFLNELSFVYAKPHLNLLDQVLAEKSPDLLDFHDDLASLEAASKVPKC